MGVVVRLAIRATLGAPPRTDKAFEGGSVVNTGYRVASVHLGIPTAVAEQIGYWPKLPPGARLLEVGAYGGMARVWEIPASVRTRVAVSDRPTEEVESSLYVSPDDDEILISDALTEALGIVVVKALSGFWRFIDDPPEKLRPSEPAQVW